MIVPEIISINAMTQSAMDNVKRLENYALTKPQTKLPLNHFIHAGMYVRTITVLAGVMITGALIRIPTVVILSGDAFTYTGKKFVRLSGYHVIPAPSPRKQIFIAMKDTDITMLFPTAAKDVNEAEKEFTEEWELLATHNKGD